ncbi:MAG: hypothetical protein ACPGUD_11910 [Parashewanella sp.]
MNIQFDAHSLVTDQSSTVKQSQLVNEVVINSIHYQQTTTASPCFVATSFHQQEPRSENKSRDNAPLSEEIFTQTLRRFYLEEKIQYLQKAIELGAKLPMSIHHPYWDKYCSVVARIKVTLHTQFEQGTIDVQQVRQVQEQLNGYRELLCGIVPHTIKGLWALAQTLNIKEKWQVCDLGTNTFFDWHDVAGNELSECLDWLQYIQFEILGIYELSCVQFAQELLDCFDDFSFHFFELCAGRALVSASLLNAGARSVEATDIKQPFLLCFNHIELQYFNGLELSNVYTVDTLFIACSPTINVIQSWAVCQYKNLLLVTGSNLSSYLFSLKNAQVQVLQFQCYPKNSSHSEVLLVGLNYKLTEFKQLVTKIKPQYLPRIFKYI